MTPAFCALAAKPSPQTIQEWLGLLERFVILLYDCSSSQECVNQARKQLFTQKGRAIENLPPQKQSDVHDRAAFLHLQRPVQLFLQLHFISSLQACAASGSVVHCASHPSSAFFHPHSFGDGSSGALIAICAQQ